MPELHPLLAARLNKPSKDWRERVSNVNKADLKRLMRVMPDDAHNITIQNGKLAFTVTEPLRFDNRHWKLQTQQPPKGHGHRYEERGAEDAT